jgi:hypothetical protein
MRAFLLVILTLWREYVLCLFGPSTVLGYKCIFLFCYKPAKDAAFADTFISVFMAAGVFVVILMIYTKFAPNDNCRDLCDTLGFDSYEITSDFKEQSCMCIEHTQKSPYPLIEVERNDQTNRP